MGHAAAGDHLFSVRTTVVWCLLFCDSSKFLNCFFFHFFAFLFGKMLTLKECELLPSR